MEERRCACGLAALHSASDIYDVLDTALEGSVTAWMTVAATFNAAPLRPCTVITRGSVVSAPVGKVALCCVV